ncbi:response regulator [Paraburkholderia sp. BCC1884]|uniref:response regulator n=1 Tax=Paraburkholderia sp. BCC1884 TaxID=2562668 RepID=UPI0011828F7D|nr:response regulator [Paraburkholderia sp. BCC1884]
MTSSEAGEDVQLDKLQIVLADDQPLFVLGTAGLIAQLRIGTVIRVASTSDALIEVLSETACDVLVMEYVMPGQRYGDGMRLLSYLRRAFTPLRVIVLTSVSNVGVCRAIWRTGVAGLVSKADSPEALPLAIHAAASGRRHLSPWMRGSLSASEAMGINATVRLSPREAEVLRLLASGLSAADVSDRLQRSPKTISRHKRSGMARLGITTDSALFQYLSGHDVPTGDAARPAPV